MEEPRVSCTISLQTENIMPQVFVGGSFSDPPWVMVPMEGAADGQGRYRWTKRIEVRPRSEVQYKFRRGSGDDWVCNEREPKMWDHNGNENNVLVAPAEEVVSDKESVGDAASLQLPRYDAADLIANGDERRQSEIGPLLPHERAPNFQPEHRSLPHDFKPSLNLYPSTPTEATTDTSRRGSDYSATSGGQDQDDSSKSDGKSRAVVRRRDSDEEAQSDAEGGEERVVRAKWYRAIIEPFVQFTIWSSILVYLRRVLHG